RLVNDPRRVLGWHAWFSELPNSVYNFAYKPAAMADVNALIELLGKIETERVVVELSPRERGWFTEGKKNRAATPVYLRVDSQKYLDQWFKDLDSDGRKKFGVTECPKAGPPTMTLFVGDSTIDLDKLVLPPRVTLASGMSKRDRDDPALAERIRRIETFAADY